MENHLNDFTQNHDKDHVSVINKKWEEHRPATSNPVPANAYTNPEGESTATVKNDRLNQQIDVVDQDLSNDKMNENKSEYVENSTIGNYIHLDNEVVAKLSEIVESFREELGTSLNKDLKITESAGEEKVLFLSSFLSWIEVLTTVTERIWRRPGRK